MKIFNLADVLEKNELFYWTNKEGEITLPGDGSFSEVHHVTSELPYTPQLVYAATEFDSDPNCYVASFRGRVGFLIKVIVNESLIGATCEKDHVKEKFDSLGLMLPSIAMLVAKTLEKRYGVSEDDYEVMIGKNTSPDRHELIYFVEYPNVSYYKKILHYLSGHIYDIIQKLAAPASAEDECRMLKFYWYLTPAQYEQFRKNQSKYSERTPADCIGSLRCGQLCFDICDAGSSLLFDLYVYGVDSGYGYKERQSETFPYDFCEECSYAVDEDISEMSFADFAHMVESHISNIIIGRGGYTATLSDGKTQVYVDILKRACADLLIW